MKADEGGDVCGRREEKREKERGRERERPKPPSNPIESSISSSSIVIVLSFDETSTKLNKLMSGKRYLVAIV
jgi:hypothetical protein